MTFTRTLTALALGTALATPALAADQIEIKYTTASVPTDLHTKAMQVFKDEL